MSPIDHEDAALKAMLRAQSSALPDDGFSQRVLAALPPPRPAAPANQRSLSWTWVAYVGGGVAGTAFVAARIGNWRTLGVDAARLANSLAAVGPVSVEPWLTIALTLCVLSLAIAWPFTGWVPAAKRFKLNCSWCGRGDLTPLCCVLAG